MLSAKFIVFALLLIGCCYALPLRMATAYGTPLFAVPVLVQNLNEFQAKLDEEPVYMLSDDVDAAEDTANSLNVEKRSVADDDDLETAAGTNVLRPLFVYRQQVAYRQRAREAIRRGRRI